MEIVKSIQAGKQLGLTAVVKHAEQFVNAESRGVAGFVDMLESRMTRYPELKERKQS